MDSKENLKNLDLPQENIRIQALVYSFTNMLSISLISQPGIKYSSSDKCFECLLKQFTIQNNTNEKFDFIHRLKPILAVYSITSPTFLYYNSTEENIDMKIDLTGGGFEKMVQPKAQALLILNEIGLAKYLYKNSILQRNLNPSHSEKLLAMIFAHLAVKQSFFCSNHLRNSEGFFVKKVNKSADDYDFHLEELNEMFSLEDQFYILWAYAELYNLLKDDKFSGFFNYESAPLFRDSVLYLLKLLKSKEYDILESDTHELSSIITSLINTLDIIDKDKKYMDFVLSLCDELYSREIRNGYVLWNKFDLRTASLATHFKCLEGLIDGYLYTNFNHFLETSRKIYDKLDIAWDDSLGLFKIHKTRSIKYTSKSIAHILQALNKLIKVLPEKASEEKLQNKLTSFFNSSVNATGLQIMPHYMLNNMFGNSNENLYNVTDFIYDEHPYIMLSGFKVNQKSTEISLNTKKFYSEYALFACNAMLDLALN
ncbi:MAG: hypothetical protein PWQ37_905 [Candidatus Petromonas sp.]|jgi:hypothetical protein|nr:hypothetical protein [Candidatus Petromonas sp.]